ncbi:MAG: AAA family ATPase [Candidatus Lokiarchaeota archaeon]|nr:AAA family ATPase [Candidatus Lokiarchaeota archaeon]
MVHKFPPTIEDLRRKRINVPASEIHFFNIIDSLSDEWYVWHSIEWFSDTERRQGEADFLLFHEQYGFLVAEVKGGIIFAEEDVLKQQNTRTGKVKKLNKSPFDQARVSMWNLKNLYEEIALQEGNSDGLLNSYDQFPLSFAYFVYFPDSYFKQRRTIRYDHKKVFDRTDIEDQETWVRENETGRSPIEDFLISLLDRFEHSREYKPDVKEFFIDRVGSEIGQVMNFKQYYSLREEELERINRVQDFLIQSLSEKNRCIFKGSAGSGKTYVAMKKAMRLLEEDKKTLFLCYNRELQDAVREHITKMTNKDYKHLKGRLDILTIHKLIKISLPYITTVYTRQPIEEELFDNFNFTPAIDALSDNFSKIPMDYKYNAIIVDEAQDFEQEVWGLLSQFLRNIDDDIFYVFYDRSQAIFVSEFSPEKFGMNEKTDTIVLKRNLRNTVEIADWLKGETEYGKYDEYSGIYGFNVTRREFDSIPNALGTAAQFIKKRYYEKGIHPRQITILGTKRLESIAPKAYTSEEGTFLKFHDKKISNEPFYIIQPDHLQEIPMILGSEQIEPTSYASYKTIRSFKGLESDIIILIAESLEDVKQKQPDTYEDYLMDIYVGASRAKFKLYFFEYHQK